MIVINNHILNEGQCMTIHAAIQNFIFSLKSEEYPLGNDEHGKLMTEAYLKNLYSINTILLSKN